MSANLDLVRSISGDWERGDFSSAEWADPEIEFVIADWPDAGTWSGLAGLTEGFGDALRAWEDFRSEAEEYRELDDERVLVLVRLSGRGKTSGLEIAHLGADVTCLFHIRDAKVTKYVVYWDRDHALADLGLAPEGETP